MAIELDMNRIPQHVAIICDGNGRWAKKRLMPRSLGHRKGGLNIMDVAKDASKLGIKCITFFCFSTENWNRPKDEVEYLMTAPIKLIEKYYDEIVNGKSVIKMIGRRDRFSPEFLHAFEDLEEKTKDHTGIRINLCIDYGSYEEITTTVKKIAQKYKDGEITLDEITPDYINDNLYTKGCPQLDLLIRTSGEERISNFLLWQLAYAEFYFTKTLWPDFNMDTLKEAIADYQARDRRFGAIKDENK